MKKLPVFLLFLSLFVVYFLVFANKANAQSCSGSYECPEYITVCRDINSGVSGCIPEEPTCNCTTEEGPGSYYACPSGWSQAVCQDSSNAFGICPGNRNATWGCYWSAPATGSYQTSYQTSYESSYGCSGTYSFDCNGQCWDVSGCTSGATCSSGGAVCNAPPPPPPPPPPPSGGGCVDPYCSFGQYVTYCDGSRTDCGAGNCTGSAGSARCNSSSPPPPSGGGSCRGVFCDTQPGWTCNETVNGSSCSITCYQQVGSCGYTGGGSAPPPPPPPPPPLPSCGDGATFCQGGITCTSISNSSGVCTTQCFDPPITCGDVSTHVINVTIYSDNDGNGSRGGSEPNYSGDVALGLTRTSTGTTFNRTVSGGFTSITANDGGYSVAITAPAGTTLTSPNPISVTIGPDRSISFGLQPPAPTPTPTPITYRISGNVYIDFNGNRVKDAGNGTQDPGETSCTPSSTAIERGNCIGGGATCPGGLTGTDPCFYDGERGYQGATVTSSGLGTRTTDANGNYTFSGLSGGSYQVALTVPGGYSATTTNPVGATVPPNSGVNFGIRASYNVVSNVRTVTDPTSCTATSGTPYTGANLNLQGGTTNLTQATNASGQTTFSAPPQTYTLSLQVPSGYDVVGRQIPSGGSASGANGMSFTVSSNTSATFCIAINDPWLQTDFGDVRYSVLNNPLPAGKYASTGTTTGNQYPGIYYSSSSVAELGGGEVSERGWLIENEYAYNTDTQNRNGTVSYNFYKARAKTEGVPVTPLTPGTLNQNEITGSGVYEVSGDLVINSYNHTSGNRVVLLASGNITVNTPISIPTGQGLFIVASKGNITIASNIGTTTLSSTTSNLDGYYSAQGSIIMPSAASCPGTPDRRLNVGGAFIANSVKPFASNGTGSVQNQRTLCDENLNYPTLYISSRLDFLTQLTDFYKVPYSKWREERP